MGMQRVILPASRRPLVGVAADAAALGGSGGLQRWPRVLEAKDVSVAARGQQVAAVGGQAAGAHRRGHLPPRPRQPAG